MDKSDLKNVSNKKDENKGGRTTIRPPVKISNLYKKTPEILCSGVDTYSAHIN